VEIGSRRRPHGNVEKNFATDTLRTRDLTQKNQSGRYLIQAPRESGRHRMKDELDSAPTPEELLGETGQLEVEKQILGRQLFKSKKRWSMIVSLALTGIGAVALVFSALYASAILAFIGLGLTFWGALLLFIRPQRYVRSELMHSTALSSLRTLGGLMSELGYDQKGVYLPADNPQGTVVFIPYEPLATIPRAEETEKQTFVTSHRGIVIEPPGLALAKLIERQIGTELRKISLDALGERLGKVLIEDLEIVENLEMHLNGNNVSFKLVDSIYSDFCNQLRDSTKVCSSIGCPFCSAIACVLSQASGKPVIFEKDEFSEDGRTIESAYRMIER